MKAIMEKQGLERAQTKETRLNEMNALGAPAGCDRDHLHGSVS